MSSSEYHKFLKQLSQNELKNAPEDLYWEGHISLLMTGTKVCVVGSRKATKSQLEKAAIITKKLVERGVTVVSGLAEGIDTAAHETAIKEGGKTITVLGTPLSKCYPKSNQQLLTQIKKEHLAISQFAEGTKTHKGSFPIRNRTMALISDASVIIAASEKSGTQHQGWEALRLGRLLFILESIATDPTLTWPKKMIQYGAQVLGENDLDNFIDLIPNYSTTLDFAY